MRIITEHIEIIDSNGTFWARVNYKAVICWYLYPQVFILKKEYIGFPSVAENGLCFPSIPNKLQWDWLFKCFLSWRKYKNKILLPYFANLQHYHLVGKFAAGEYSAGILGIEQYMNEK